MTTWYIQRYIQILISHLPQTRVELILFMRKHLKTYLLDITLRSVAAVTSLGGGGGGGGLTSINICMHFDSSQPLAEHSYQSYLTYLE